MTRSMLLTLCLLIITPCLFAQKIPLINSGDVMKQGITLYDSGKYEEAIAKFLTIPKRDTNYMYMLTELALTYNAAKQYDKALAVCEEILAKPSLYEADILRTQAIATDKKGDFTQSVNLFQKAIEKRPFDFVLIYNLGITYYNNKEYDKAVDCFFKVLSINPFHPGSHLNLGRISIGRGRKTHAMLSFGMYLSVSNSDNSRLVLVDKLVSNQVEEENTLPVSGPNGCEKLDQIIRSKIAMDDNFKTKVPVSAPVSRQYEMLFEQLGTINKKTDDRWVSFYLPIYTSIKEQNMIEPFLYNILASTTIEPVKKWRKKNEKILEEFYSLANTTIKKNREIISAPSKFGFSKPVQAWYTSGNKVDALGAKQNDKNEGRWVYFNDTDLISAEGNYTNGEKTGTWKYYYNTGELKNIENYETGEVTVYYKEGTKSQHFFLKNDLIDGEVELYYAFGGLKEKLMYSNGKRNGPGQSYYLSGKKKMSFEYKEDVANGEFTTLFEEGYTSHKNPYKDDKFHGMYEEYHSNGKKKVTGEYVEGEANGTWKYYHNNGQLEKEGNFAKGLSVGTWTHYDRQGVLTAKTNFNAKGEWHGETLNYTDGKLHITLTYKDDMLVKIVYTDKNGKEVGKFGNPDGSFASKIFYASGQMNGEGSYKKGNVHGTWKYYFPEGSQLSEYTYVDGYTQGEATEYFRTGQKKFIFQYKDGQYHGYFQEFHPNGKIKQEGWYQNGMRQQQWLMYYPDGTLESDYYYLNDNLLGAADDYNTDGKKYMTTMYGENENVIRIDRYNPEGMLITKSRVDNGKKIFETFYPSGKTQTRYELLEGSFHGTIAQSFPDGKIYFEYDMANNVKHGKYKHYGVNNQLELEGISANGSQSGKRTAYYPSGKTEYIGFYIEGDIDSTWTNYFPHGAVASLMGYAGRERHGITRYNAGDGTPVVEKFFEKGSIVAYRTVNSAGQFGEWIPFKGNEAISAKYPDGTKAYEEQYKNGLIQGARRIYFPDGKLADEQYYKDGDYNGPFQSFYPNGKLYEKGQYESDELTGVVETYNEDGTLLQTVTYQYSVKNGKAVIYNKGQKIKEYTFWAGTPQQ